MGAEEQALRIIRTKDKPKLVNLAYAANGVLTRLRVKYTVKTVNVMAHGLHYLADTGGWKASS
jgi:hypothetical protein